MTSSASSPHRIDVLPQDPRRHSVWVGQGAMACAEAWDALPRGRLAVIVTSDVVGPLYAAPLKAVLAQRFERVEAITLPDGEAHKAWPAMEHIFAGLLAARADRQTLLVALGGGVVSDVAGLAAALFMRGMPWLGIPTTLLAQVDASVGGKTAINLPQGKNLVGTFSQPVAVLADTDVLASLPPREWRAGMAEVLKMALLGDAVFWAQLQQDAPLLAQPDLNLAPKMVARCVAAKAAIVAADERETSGQRALLNLGHTFGHAIEAVQGYGDWLHGEAVAAGLVMAADLSARMGWLSIDEARSVRTPLQAMGLPTAAPPVSADALLAAMQSDKKAAGGRIPFVLLRRLGEAVLAPADFGLVRDTLLACGARA